MLDRQLSPRAGVALVVVTLLGLAGLVAFLLGGEGGPPHGPSPASRSVTAPEAALADFVGDQACEPCHPSIYRAHHHSRHAVTLHPMRPGHLPVPIPDHARFNDPATGLAYRLDRRGEQYVFSVLTPGEPLSQPVEFLFGSGKTGVTLVSRADEGRVREFRMSYFHLRHRWEVTPGQRGAAADPLGKVHGHEMSQRCFTCHATVVAASRILPEPRFMGVGCEACHGPGRHHVDAIHRRSPEHAIDNPGYWDGDRVNQLCGRCHRTQQDLDPLDTFANSQTQRFQPLGLAKSACFRASAGRLTCITCHDAHEDARLDAGHYERVCLSCHGGQGNPTFFDAKTRKERKRETDLETRNHASGVALSSHSCPVNPRSGCITCHMPNREVVRGISMADHWIRVVRSPSTGSSTP
jgi:hypothetical protein